MYIHKSKTYWFNVCNSKFQLLLCHQFICTSLQRERFPFLFRDHSWNGLLEMSLVTFSITGSEHSDTQILFAILIFSTLSPYFSHIISWGCHNIPWGSGQLGFQYYILLFHDSSIPVIIFLIFECRFSVCVYCF